MHELLIEADTGRERLRKRYSVLFIVAHEVLLHERVGREGSREHYYGSEQRDHWLLERPVDDRKVDALQLRDGSPVTQS